MKSKTILIVLLLASFFGYSQQPASITITGTVTGSSGMPLEGATVVASKAARAAAATDINGKFVFKVQPGAVITISYIGFQEQSPLRV